MRIINLSSVDTSKDMFDKYINTQTTVADQIQESFDVSNKNAIGVFNNYGTELICEVTDNDTSTTYYSKTVSLIRDNVSDWWDYFFAPVRIGRDTVFYFESRSNATATITINYTGGTAKCGMCVPGIAKEIATTKYGVETGINDYSQIKTNDFGLTYLSAGNYAKLASAELNVRNTSLDLAYRNIVKNRGVETIFDYNEYDTSISSGHTSQDKYQALIVYGFTEDFDVEIPGPTLSQATHDVQGIT